MSFKAIDLQVKQLQLALMINNTTRVTSVMGGDGKDACGSDIYNTNLKQYENSNELLLRYSKNDMIIDFSINPASHLVNVDLVAKGKYIFNGKCETGENDVTTIWNKSTPTAKPSKPVKTPDYTTQAHHLFDEAVQDINAHHIPDPQLYPDSQK